MVRQIRLLMQPAFHQFFQNGMNQRAAMTGMIIRIHRLPGRQTENFAGVNFIRIVQQGFDLGHR